MKDRRAWGGHVRRSKEVHRMLSARGGRAHNIFRGQTPVIPVRGRAGVSAFNIHQNGKDYIKIRLELSNLGCACYSDLSAPNNFIQSSISSALKEGSVRWSISFEEPCMVCKSIMAKDSEETTCALADRADAWMLRSELTTIQLRAVRPSRARCS